VSRTSNHPSPEAMVEQLIELAQAQRDAALGLDIPAMNALTQKRADLAFALRIRLTDVSLSPALKAAAVRLQESEERLARALGTVLGAIRPLSPQAGVKGYGSNGQMRGA
jgi:hypothetical protein